MLITFKYDKQQVIEGLRFHFMKRPEIRIFKTFLFVVVIFSFIGYFTHYISFNTLLWFFLLAVVLLLFLWYLLPYSVYVKARTFKEPVIKLRWDEDRLYIGTERGESRVNWERFEKVVETKDFFYLYQTNKAFFLVPQEGFDSQKEYEDFSVFLKRKFSDYTLE